MRVHLAAVGTYQRHMWESKPLYILYSFYSHSKEEIKYSHSNHCKGYLVDSGAFSFMNSPNIKGEVNFDQYVKDYAKFLVENKVKRYFELDIDSIVGLKQVEKYRTYLENETGIQSIPVFHKSRGKDYFLQMIDEYDYVSIGGIVTKEIKRSELPLLKWFIDMAHKNNTQIHGLGLTNIPMLKKLNFDSVDSTSWKCGRHGVIMRFNPVTHIFDKFNFSDVCPNTRIQNSKELTQINIKEWVKFQYWAENNL